MLQKRRLFQLLIFIQYFGQLYNDKGVYNDCLKMIIDIEQKGYDYCFVLFIIKKGRKEMKKIMFKQLVFKYDYECIVKK